MLEVLRWSPKQKSARHVSFGKIRVNFERPPAVEFGFLQPHAGRVEFEMAGCACEREGRVSEGKQRIASDRIGEMVGLLDPSSTHRQRP